MVRFRRLRGMFEWGLKRIPKWFVRLVMGVMLVAGAAVVVAAPSGALAASAGVTCTTSQSGSVTCVETGSNGAVIGTCTVTGASSCVPQATGAESSAVSGNLQTLKQELTPNMGAVFTNPVTAPLVKLGFFLLSCVALYYLGMALYHLVLRVHEQASGKTFSHESLKGPVFAVGVLLLIVAGGATWLLVGMVQAAQALMHG
jgi:succinate dehydrogenase/fumarate reductase cytochrome b subunit